MLYKYVTPILSDFRGLPAFGGVEVDSPDNGIFVSLRKVKRIGSVYKNPG
jgi:hypothetical protein